MGMCDSGTPDAPQTGQLLGQQYRLLKKFYPKLADFSFEQMQKFAPQLADLTMQLQEKYGLAMGQEAKSEMQALNPEYYSMRDALGKTIQAGIGQGLSPDQSNYFGQQMAQGQAARGMYQSPLSAQNTAYNLTQMDAAQRQQNLGNASGFLGGYGMFGAPNVGIPGGNQMPQMQQMYGDIGNLNNNLAAMQYAGQMAQANQQSQLWGGLGSSLLQAGGTLGGAAISKPGPSMCG